MWLHLAGLNGHDEQPPPYRLLRRSRFNSPVLTKRGYSIYRSKRIAAATRPVIKVSMPGVGSPNPSFRYGLALRVTPTISRGPRTVLADRKYSNAPRSTK